MRFGQVEIPRELIGAHEADELVIFVGAGASMGAPSGLPSFVGLTSIIRDESQLTDVVGDLGNRPLDEVMGEIEDMHEVDVHLRVAAHTGKESSLPNDLHRAVADLARCGTVRVITTNYDTHLSTALGTNVVTYLSPALPIGGDFTGLVYLHGCVTQPSRHLVVTAGDFGRAYLTDAWATRFLERMFASYTTLFIGYSHNDVIINYLARGLGPHAKPRYICTSEPQSPMWKQLNIIPIGYSPADKHRALPRAIQGWADRATRGLLGHQQQVGSIMASSRKPSDLTLEESSYLQFVVSDTSAAQFFCQHAQGRKWLMWVSDQPAFVALFDPKQPGPSTSWRLANWFAETYITIESSADALAVFRRLGGRFSPQLWDAVARRLDTLCGTGTFAATVRPWLPVLTGAATDRPVIFLDMLLSSCSLPADAEAAMLLFTYLTEPQIVYDRPSVLGGLQPEVRLRREAGALQRIWDDVFKPALELENTAASVLPVIEQHLRRAQRDTNLGDESGSGVVLGSPVQLIATSSGSGDRYAAALGFLVGAARDSAMLAHSHQSGYYGTEWARFPASRDLAKACWSAIGTEAAEERDDWLHTALNSPAGNLASFWITVAEIEETQVDGDSHRLSPGCRQSSRHSSPEC